MRIGLHPAQPEAFRTYMEELQAARPRLHLTAVELADRRLEPRARAWTKSHLMEAPVDSRPAQAHNRGGGQ